MYIYYCSGVKAVKYIYKYIYIRHDKAVVYIAQDDRDNIIDEINKFQDARWVSPQETIWRIFQFELIEMSTPVINMQLHLPNKQTIYYWKNQNLQNVLYWDHVSRTMLTWYFETCANNSNARTICIKNFLSIMYGTSKVKTWQKDKTELWLAV